MRYNIDASVFPDVEPPTELRTLEQRADYVHRVISAFDFGITPDTDTIRLFAQWRDVFDRFPLLASPGYHALRTFYRWPQLERAPCFLEPTYLKLDRLEGREDGFEDRI